MEIVGELSSLEFRDNFLLQSYTSYNYNKTVEGYIILIVSK